MINLFWKLIAKILSRPAIVDWLIDQAMKTPYTHIQNMDRTDVYMYRYWLFNPYPTSSMFPVSIRLHKIMRADQDQHLHDHPWNARTIILRSLYMEERLENYHTRRAGDTATLKFGEYHRINFVPKEGVWTLFITYKYQGTWGFLVNGTKILHKEYNKNKAS